MKYPNQDMTFMPINLSLKDKEVLIVGGGKVAWQKIRRIRSYTLNIRVVAIKVCDEIKELGISYSEKPYKKSDLGNSFLVYACTDNNDLNQEVYNDAHELNKLVNVTDNPPISDFVSPATILKDNMTISVGSNGQDVNKAIRWRNRIKKLLEHIIEE